MTSTKLSKPLKTNQQYYSCISYSANKNSYYFRLATTITVVLMFSSFLSVVSSARLSTRNGLDTIKSLENPEGLIHRHSWSLNKMRQWCSNVYRNQKFPPPSTSLISTASFIASTDYSPTTPRRIIKKRTVNVNLKWGNKRYKCNFMYYDGCESKCRKVDQCLKDQGFNVGYSTCVNKKKEADSDKISQENNSNSNNSRSTRRILRRKIRHGEIRN